MNDWLLNIIRCPITGRALELASEELVNKLREQSRAGQLVSHKGIALAKDFEAGLVDQSKAYFYRIQDGILRSCPMKPFHLASRLL